MKKIITALSASALALSVALFTACSTVSKDGTISGNYREAEDADIQQLLTTLSEGDVFGDMEAEDWRYGLHGEASLDFSVQQDTYAANAGIDADLGILFESGSQNFLAGGSLGVNAEIKTGDQTQSSVDFQIHPYLDDEYIYLNISGTQTSAGGESSVEQRGKIAYGGFGLTLPNLEDIPSLLALVFGNSDPADFRASLESSGVTMDVDTSSGFKARFTFSSDGIAEAVKEALGSLSTVDTSGYDVNVVSDTLEMYVMLDEQGVLSAVSVRTDVEVNVPDPGFDYSTMQVKEDAGTLTFALKGMFALTNDDADIVFPSDLESYPDLDLSGLI